METGLLILRVVVGVLFVAHGTQKLFGWFGGYGIEGTAGFMGQLRYRRPRLAAMSAGVFETGAGLFLAIGLLTPLAAAAIVGVMLNATVSAKLQSGLFDGYELEALYATVAASLAFTGPGTWSIDRALDWNLAGTAWGLVAVAFGVVIGVVVLASRTSQAPVSERALAVDETGRQAA